MSIPISQLIPPPPPPHHFPPLVSISGEYWPAYAYEETTHSEEKKHWNY